MKVKYYVGGIGLLMAATSYGIKSWMNYEPQITRYTISDSRWKGLGRLRIALVSDFHGGEGIWSGESLAKLVLKENADLVCVCGDHFEPAVHGKEAFDFFDYIGYKRPTYFVTGNHDEGIGILAQVKDAISKKGVHVLDNASKQIIVRGGLVEIVGLRDQAAYGSEDNWAWAVQKAFRNHHNEKKSESFHILMCHRPEKTFLFDQFDAHLVLSGHAHGGQWRFAKKGLYAPGQGVFPKYTSGIYDLGKKKPYKLVVGSGFGLHKFIPRIQNRPELVMIDVKAE